MRSVLGRKPIGTIAYMGGVMSVPEDFAWCWGQMCAYNQEIWLGDKPTEFIHYSRSTFSDHAPARNQLVSSMQGDWLIQFDTDHVFDCDIAHRLVRLADEAGVDVVSAVYQFKPRRIPCGVPSTTRFQSSDRWMVVRSEAIGNWSRWCRLFVRSPVSLSQDSQGMPRPAVHSFRWLVGRSQLLQKVP